MLTGRRSRLPTHALISLSRTDPLHTLSLTTCLALCRADRKPAPTSNLPEHNFCIVHTVRMNRPRAVREGARLVGLLAQIGKVRQDQRGAAEAMVPRLYACVVRCVARAARGRLCTYVRMSAIREDLSDRTC